MGVKHSIEDSILDIVTNSDNMTWKSIDALRSLFSELMELLNSIKSSIESNSTEQTHESKQNSGKPSTIEDRETKEAMTQTNETVPESFKNHTSQL